MVESKQPTKEQISDRMKFAHGLYDTARAHMDEVEDLFTGAYVLKKEQEDQEVDLIKPPRAMAILGKFVSRLATRAEVGIQVVPRTLGDAEEKVCTTLERWLEGYRFQAEYEAMNPIYRYFVTWFCLRGRGCLELRLRPQYAEGQKFQVVRPIIDDPKKISPVYGETGIMFYAKKYKRSAWDLRQELGEKFAGGKDLVWQMPSGLEAEDATKELEIEEYWDKDWHAAYIEGEEVYLKKNPMGFVPLVEAKAMDTPLEAAEWASQSILYPLMDMLKKQAELMSKGITGLEVFYYPWVLVREPGGRSYIMETTPGTIQSIHPDAEITVLNPTPNQQLLHQLGMMVQDEINLLALPEISWGAEPGTLQSGRAISQVLAQTLDVIEDKRQNLERTLGWHFGGVLRLVEQYAELDKNKKFSVMAIPEEKGRKRRDLVSIGKEEIDGHYRVIVNLSPPMPEDKMMRYEIARRASDLGKDGYPQLDARTILTDVLEVGNPDEVRERIEKQVVERMSPEIMAYKKSKYLKEFCDEEGISYEEFMTMAQEGMPEIPGGMGEMGGQPPSPGIEGEMGRPGPGELPPEEYGPGPETPGPEEAALIGAPA